MNLVSGSESLYALCTLIQNGWEMIELVFFFLLLLLKMSSLHSVGVQDYVAFHFLS